MTPLLAIFERGLFGAVLLGGLVWSGLAVYVQLSGAKQWLAWALLLALGLAIAVLYLKGRIWGWGALALAALLIGVLYHTIRPSQDRIWAADVARIVRAERQGEIVYLHDIRDFAWISKDEAEENWVDGSYDLRELSSLDMGLSTWSSPNIAHLLVSFGFKDGRHVVFSAEIRREKGEVFSELGGFFRQFELALIAATERDIFYLRTHMRGERVTLYPVDLPQDQMRRLFLAYVALANDLEAKARFYNTITANCTTVVWRLARALGASMPLRPSLLFSGRLPAYLESQGFLKGGAEGGHLLDPATITAAMSGGASYSEAMRAEGAATR